jgi:DNA repair protein RadC
MIEIADLLRPFLRGGDLPFRLVRQYGGLRGLLRAPAESILAEPGAGHATVRTLRSLERLARLFFEESLPVGTSIASPADTEEFLVAKLRDLPHELFCCIYLDNRHRVIEFEELFRGTIDGTSVHPREVVKRALAVNAAAVIFAHNHPSGVAEPSQADEPITRRLQAALEIVEIRLLDHLVIGDGTATSLARRGMV